MAKQFTKVTKTYSTKNKLQQLILQHLELVDGTLYPNKTAAVTSIKKLYEVALKSYKGKAVVPKLDYFQANKKDLVYQVEDVIHISIYNVQTDVS